jgi:DNA-binding response OmpR family regulator
MGTLLIVEPHVDTAELVAELLRSVGFETRTYASADGVDEALDDLRPGLLLASVGPRDRAAVGGLVAQANARAIPIVLLSTTPDREWPGADAVLTKPFDNEVLLRTVRAFYRP